MKHKISMTWLANPNRGRSHFPHNVWSLYEYTNLYQSEDFRAHYAHIGPPITLTIELKTVNIF